MAWHGVGLDCRNSIMQLFPGWKDGAEFTAVIHHSMEAILFEGELKETEQL